MQQGPSGLPNSLPQHCGKLSQSLLSREGRDWGGGGRDGLRRGRDGGAECWMEIKEEGEVYWALLERRYEE